jgi:hypothetical protein
MEKKEFAFLYDSVGVFSKKYGLVRMISQEVRNLMLGLVALVCCFCVAVLHASGWFLFIAVLCVLSMSDNKPNYS